MKKLHNGAKMDIVTVIVLPSTNMLRNFASPMIFHQ